jgi:hypothetical protein
VTWTITTEVGRFLAEGMPFLVSDPVANTVLLTEAHFWRRLSNPVPGARFGWWAEGDKAHGAFVHIPEHAVVCSPLDPASIADLPGVLANASHLGVEARDVDAVTAAWRAKRQVLRPRARITLLRLHDFRSRAFPEGAPRLAIAGDLPLLRSWFQLFQEQNPDDASHVEFVVDHPLEEGGVTLWEVDSRPVAMASRTSEVAGMVRMGLAFQPTRGNRYADAAFDVGCAEAARTAEHVLVLSGTPEATTENQSLGFTPVQERVVLEVAED